MATFERYMTAARNADAAGDEAAARRLVQLAQQARQGEEQPKKNFARVLWENVVGDDDPTTQNTGEKIGAWLNKAGESMTAGLIGDEASAALESLVPGVNYEDRRDHYRQQEALLEQTNPNLALGADIAGALVPIGGVGLAARGASMGRRMALGGLAAGAQGGLYGAMEGEGGEDRLRQAAIGAGIGVGAGAALPPVAALARRAVSPAVEAITGALGMGNAKRAERAIGQAVNRSGKSADDLQREMTQAAAEGQPEYMFADALGNPGQRTLAGIARRPGDARTQIVDALESRQQGQGERLAAFLEDSFGFRGQPSPGPLAQPQRSAQGATEALRAARGAAADVAYPAAREGAEAVDVRAAVARIDDRIGGMQGSNISGDSIDAKLSKYRGRLMAAPPPNGEISRELSDFDRVLGVKQDLQDDIGAAIRAGRNNEARLLGQVSKELDAALEASSDGYRAANDDFARASGVIDAVDEGAAMARPGARAADTTADFARMTPEQQAAARLGYGDKALAKVEGTAGPGTNRARPLTSPKSEQERAAFALDPDRLQRRVDRENVMFETRRQATGGSQTADNLADQAESAGYDMSAVGNLMTGNFRTGTQQLVAALSQAAKGQNEGTREIIARALLSRDPQGVLQQAMQRTNSDQTRKAIQDALAVVTASRGGYSITQNP